MLVDRDSIDRSPPASSVPSTIGRSSKASRRSRQGWHERRHPLDRGEVAQARSATRTISAAAVDGNSCQPTCSGPSLDETGVLSTEPDYLSAALGLTDEMIIDLIEWGLASATHDIPQDAYARRGAELAERLRAELAGKHRLRTGSFG